MAAAKELQRAIPADVLTDITQFTPPAARGAGGAAGQQDQDRRPDEAPVQPHHLERAGAATAAVPVGRRGEALLPGVRGGGRHGSEHDRAELSRQPGLRLVACRELVPDLWDLCDGFPTRWRSSWKRRVRGGRRTGAGTGPKAGPEQAPARSGRWPRPTADPSCCRSAGCQLGRTEGTGGAPRGGRNGFHAPSGCARRSLIAMRAATLKPRPLWVPITSMFSRSGPSVSMQACQRTMPSVRV